MKVIRALLIAVLMIPALPAQAAEEQASAFGHALTLVDLFVRIAAESQTSEQSLKAIDDVLLGRNPVANEAALGLLSEMLVGLPPEQRATVAAIGRNLASMARKEMKAPGAGPYAALSPLQARKDLTSMGLTYHDSKQFLDAVKRNDAIAAELFIAGRGVDLSVTDFWGRDAEHFARSNGNERLAGLIARNRPAAR